MFLLQRGRIQIRCSKVLRHRAKLYSLVVLLHAACRLPASMARIEAGAHCLPFHLQLGEGEGGTPTADRSQEIVLDEQEAVSYFGEVIPRPKPVKLIK